MDFGIHGIFSPNVQISQLLPPYTPALPYLLELELSHLGLRELGDSAIPLQRLTRLDLTHNSLACIPAEIIEITALKSLNVSGNDSLQLEYRDVNILAALPYLQELILGTGDETSRNRWSFQSMRIVLCLSKSLPDLDVLV